jgi:hypothetical protein
MAFVYVASNLKWGRLIWSVIYSSPRRLSLNETLPVAWLDEQLLLIYATAEARTCDLLHRMTIAIGK